MSQKIEWIRFEDQKLSIAIDQNTKLVIKMVILCFDNGSANIGQGAFFVGHLYFLVSSICFSPEVCFRETDVSCIYYHPPKSGRWGHLKLYPTPLLFRQQFKAPIGCNFWHLSS